MRPSLAPAPAAPAARAVPATPSRRPRAGDGLSRLLLTLWLLESPPRPGPRRAAG
ncbi:MAG TPA: hypothetical protein VK279_00375 [Solirubrobacteraceae bacterium]|nr:hypothetical protein [Solirubrobacteraceae bacterium]